MSILRTEGIIKDYPGTRALDDVTVSFDSGKVHAFIGKNGSGKSTLVKVFAGAIQPTSGHFYLDEEELHFSTPVEALNKGIATVYQELSLVSHNQELVRSMHRRQVVLRRGQVARDLAREAAAYGY